LELSGFLNKRSESSVVKSWQKRWCEVQDGTFTMAKSKEMDAKHSIDMSEFTAKKADDNETDKKHCLKLVPRDPTKRSYLLQAANDEEMNHWIQVLRNSSALGVRRGIQDIKGGESSTFVNLKPYIDSLFGVPGNEICVDCSSPCIFSSFFPFFFSFLFFFFSSSILLIYYLYYLNYFIFIKLFLFIYLFIYFFKYF
jgi:hypothetical protein